MGLMRYSTGAALAALMVVAAVEPSSAQTPASPAPAQAAPQTPAAGALNPAAEEAPQRTAPAPQFRLSDGIIATVNDRIITGFDLRQRMLVLMAMTQVQPTEENIGAIQQQALNDLIDQHLQAAELTKFEQLKIGDAEIDQEIADMARQAGATPASCSAPICSANTVFSRRRKYTLPRSPLGRHAVGARPHTRWYRRSARHK